MLEVLFVILVGLGLSVLYIPLALLWWGLNIAGVIKLI